MKVSILVALFMMICFSSVVLAEGDLMITNMNGLPLMSINTVIYSGQINTTSFKIKSLNTNISFIGFYHVGDMEINITPNILNNVSNTESIINISIDPKTSEAGMKSEKIIVLTSKPETKVIDVIVSIPEHTSWNITPREFNKTLHYNEAGMFEIEFENDGNNLVTLNHKEEGDTNYFWIETQDIVIPSHTTIKRPIFYFVRDQPRLYSINITFTDQESNNKIVNISLLIPDLSIPDISNITVSPQIIYQKDKFTISANVTDNVQIKNCWIVFNGNITPMDYTDGYCSVISTINKTGTYRYIIYANDTSGNTKLDYADVKISQYDFVEFSSPIRFGKFRIYTERDIYAFRIQKPIILNVSLASLSFPITLKMKWNGGNYVFDENHTEVNLDGVIGEVRLTASAVNETPFEGMLNLKTEENIKGGYLSFSGIVADYSVTEPTNYNLTEYHIELDCDPNDVGNYDNSSYNCKMAFPIDVEFDKVPFAMPLPLFKSFRQSYEDRVATITLQRDNEAFWRWTFMILFFAIVITMAFYWFSWKDSRVRFR